MQPFDNDRAAQLEAKWIDSGELTAEELALLEVNDVHNPDSGVRERCRVILAAIAKRYEGDPAVKTLLCARHEAAFLKLIRPLPGTEGPTTDRNESTS